MSPYQTDFITNLKYYRAQKGYSQAKLAEMCECGTGTIGSIESARQFPSFDLLFKISDVLEINPADLFVRGASLSRAELKTILQTEIADGIEKLIDTSL